MLNIKRALQERQVGQRLGPHPRRGPPHHTLEAAPYLSVLLPSACVLSPTACVRGSFFLSSCQGRGKSVGFRKCLARLQKWCPRPVVSTHLSKHVESHIHRGQQGAKGWGHFRVKGGSGEVQGKQEVVLGQVQGLLRKTCTNAQGRDQAHTRQKSGSSRECSVAPGPAGSGRHQE